MMVSRAYKCFLFVMLIFPAELLAQDIIGGYIIKLDGDTVRGTVRYVSSNSKEKACRFRQDGVGKWITYTPDLIKGYGYQKGRQFVSRVVNKETSESLFLEQLVRGPLSLYRVENSFFVEKDSLIALPYDSKQIEMINGNPYRNRNRRFYGYLNIVLADCKMTSEQVSNNQKSLEALVNRYNACKGFTATSVDRKYISFSTYVMAGLDNGASTFDGYLNYQVKRSNSPILGMGMEVSAPNFNENAFLTVELQFLKKYFQGYDQYKNPDTDFSTGSVVTSDLYYKSSYLKLPIGVRWNLMREDHAPYVRFGAVTYFAMTQNASVNQEVRNAQKQVSTTYFDSGLSQKSPIGLWAGLGWNRRLTKGVLFFVECRYEYNTGYVNPKPDSKSFGNNVSFFLGLKH